MKKINYSIIIPHKNIPNLLRRCLDSIPRREDIQIIVVDDNSDEDKVDFKNFPGVGEECVEVYFTKEGKGAGYARNVGLKHAKGKWLLFADADDFFTENINGILDEYIDNENEITYFCLTSVVSETLKPANRAIHVNDDIIKSINGCVESRDKVRYKFLYPSSKIISKSLIIDNKIQFDEVPASNDTMFGVKVACKAKSIGYSNVVLYCLTLRQNSLVTSYKYENLKSRLLISFDLFYFLKQFDKEEYAQSSVDHWMQIRHCSFVYFLKDFYLLFNLPIRVLVKQFLTTISNVISK